MTVSFQFILLTFVAFTVSDHVESTNIKSVNDVISNEFKMCKDKNGTMIEKDVCLTPNYDKFKIPTTSYPLKVSVHLMVFGLKDVNMMTHTYSLYKTLYKAWTDPNIIGNVILHIQQT